MKKFLPKSVRTPQGFTLIELLVVITIISILSVVGFVTYSGVSARARDTKRIEEINAIQKAMEKNYQPGVGYVVLAGTDFSNGTVVADPWTGQNKCGTGGAQVCDYCAFAAGTASANYAACANKVSTTQPAASNVGYVVCANLETAAGAAGARYYCVKNVQ